jgi:hypothetical protein
MEMMDKYAAIHYIISNNPVCVDCARGNLEHLRMAAGLYQLLKDIASGNKGTYTIDELAGLIARAISY